MSNRQPIVFEQPEWAGVPLLPEDLARQYDGKVAQQQLTLDGLDAQAIQVNLPRAGARLVIPVTRGERPLPQAWLYDVHYTMLGLAGLSDYEDPVVRYTAYGIIKRIGLSYNGRHAENLRRSVLHLRAMQLEIDGEFEDPAIRGQMTRQLKSYSVLIGHSFPVEEDRGSGRRNTSTIEYNPKYLAGLRHSGVPVDLHLMTQIRGGIKKAFYREACRLRAAGIDRIPVLEMYERTGCMRKATFESYVRRTYADALSAMLEYGILRKPVRVEKDGSEDVLRFEWGEPIPIRSGDTLLRAFTAEGISADDAARMILTDKARAVRLMQVVQADALPMGGPGAAQIIDWFYNDGWDADSPSELPAQKQTALHFPPRPAPKSTPDLDWDRLRETGGDLSSFQYQVLLPLLAAVGDPASEQAICQPEFALAIQRAFERLGWAKAVDVTRRLALYLPGKAKPLSYVAKGLYREAEQLAPEAPEQAGAAPADRPRGSDTPAPPPERINATGALIALLQAKLLQLGALPSSANEVLAFAERRAREATTEEETALLLQLRSKANEILAR